MSTRNHARIVASAGLALALGGAPPGVGAAEASIEATAREIIAAHLDVPLEGVVPGARLADLGADGLDVLEIVLALEQALGVEIADDRLGRVVSSESAFDPGVATGTVSDLVRLFEPRAASSQPEQERDGSAEVADSRLPPSARRGGTATRARPRPRPRRPGPAGSEPETASPTPHASPPAPDGRTRRAGTATRALPRPEPQRPRASAPGPGGAPAADSAYREALDAYYAAILEKNRADAATLAALGSYELWALENRKRVIERQQASAMIVLAVVILLVLSGVVFSGIQFYIAMRHVRRGDAAPATTLKASLGSVEVSSSVLGVIVLVISLLFFYLYLDRVFNLAVLPD